MRGVSVTDLPTETIVTPFGKSESIVYDHTFESDKLHSPTCRHHILACLSAPDDFDVVNVRQYFINSFLFPFFLSFFFSICLLYLYEINNAWNILALKKNVE